MKKVLLVVDVQKGFTRGSNELVDKINEYLKHEKYDEVVSTIFINHKDSNYIKYINWSRIMEL